MGCPARPQGTNLLPPVDHQEVWAAGVTYAWSREARVREAAAKEIYVKVYEAPRPELFFKSTPDKVVGHQDWVGIRGDSRWNVPESSRDIEGENPLYLPQAKIYEASCALGPGILLGAHDDWPQVTIALSIERGGQTLFAGQVRTDQIQRSLAELVAYLGRSNTYPDGAVLLTGTGVVPPAEFTLARGDIVRIAIDGIGELVNPVKVV